VLLVLAAHGDAPQALIPRHRRRPPVRSVLLCALAGELRVGRIALVVVILAYAVRASAD
jgi:hypothetical protein